MLSVAKELKVDGNYHGMFEKEHAVMVTNTTKCDLVYVKRLASKEKQFFKIVAEHAKKKKTSNDI